MTKYFAGRELETGLWCVKDGSVDGPRCSTRYVGVDAQQQAERRAAEMNADDGNEFRTLYSSVSFMVTGNKDGVEVTNMHTGFTAWVQGERAADTRGGIEVIPARVPSTLIETATDQYLTVNFPDLAYVAPDAEGN